MRHLVLLAALAPACSGYNKLPWPKSQRWPEPMEWKQDPLPPGDATQYPRGPEEVRIVRHADPVHVRVADSVGVVSLSYRRKEMRVASGSGIASAGGGRVEILWSTGSSVVLSGHTAVIIGSPSRGEPSLLFRQIEQVRFDPQNEDLYELVGGATLRVRMGPVRVESVRPEVLRVANESKGSAQIAFRDTTIVLDPGQAVDLPLLSFGGKPTGEEAILAPFAGAGFAVQHAEGTDLSAEAGTLRAKGTGDVRALGVRVHLESGAEAQFQARPGAPAPPSEGAPKLR